MIEAVKRFIKPTLIKIVPDNFIIWKRCNAYRKLIALTFDDGPDPIYTLKFLEILRKNNIRATFFLVGNKIEKYPNLALKILENRHEIGNHSYSHNNHSKSKLGNIEVEVDETQNIIRKITGVDSTLFRPPFGILSFGILRYCIKKGLTIVMWSVDPEDHHATSIDGIRNNLRAYFIAAGDIILMHDNNSYTLRFLPEMIRGLKVRRFRFVTVSELLNFKR